MPRPIEALVHRDALAANLAVARAAAAGAKVWAVVKADAYGHGIAHVYPALQGADGFALLDIAEAERLRELGWRGPILLLEGAFDGRDLETCARLHLWHVVHCTAQIDLLAALKTDRPQHVFLKMNSGMNRLGFAPESLRAAWLRLDALAQVGEITLMTHLADADAADEASVEPRAGRVRRRDARPAGRSLDRQQRRDAAPRRTARRRPATGCGRASCSTARRPTTRCTAPPTGAWRRR